jgi:NADH dehydrogenase FAD-containing subunit
MFSIARTTTTRIARGTAGMQPFLIGSHGNSVAARCFGANPYTVEKPRVLILGTGWGGHTLAKRLDKDKFDVRVISPANHFLFTPLLPSTAVGTLEFRAIQEPVRTIEGLGEYYQAKAMGLDTNAKVVHCEDLFKKHKFKVKYDYLCIAAGNKTNTFNIPGVQEEEGNSVLFLKHLYHARLIRNRILECFERASNRNVSPEERSRLLSFIVVGGGPTSCEFTAELYDFIHDDVSKWYPDLKYDIKLTLVEAGPGLLGSFDKSLADYYLKGLRKRNVDVRLSTAVTGVHERRFAASDGDDEGRCYTVASFGDETELPFGMMVWSAGLAPVKFVEESGLKLERGHIVVDEYLRVPESKGRIFAIGDCAGIEGGGLPPTAQVAEQQAYYLGDAFNEYYSKFDSLDPQNDNKDVPLPGPIVPALLPLGGLVLKFNRFFTKPSPRFQYMNRGAMAAMGFGGGVQDLTKTDLPLPKVATSGFAAFAMWRSVYLTKQLSYTNMILIPMYWFKQMVFGRDISRF